MCVCELKRERERESVGMCLCVSEGVYSQARQENSWDPGQIINVWPLHINNIST